MNEEIKEMVEKEVAKLVKKFLNREPEVLADCELEGQFFFEKDYPMKLFHIKYNIVIESK